MSRFASGITECIRPAVDVRERESLHDKTVWKPGLEDELDLETKVMFGCGMKDRVEE